MAAVQHQSVEWQIFNAAILFLEPRELLKGGYGEDKDGFDMDTDDILRSPQKASCVCAIGSLYAGAGSIGVTAESTVYACVEKLDDFVLERTKGIEHDTSLWNDDVMTTKDDLLEVLKSLRDKHA